MKLKKQVVRRKIAGQSLLIPVGEMTGKYNGVFTLTPLGDLIIELIMKGLDEAAIVRELLENYDVDKETAENDLREFLQILMYYGIIE